MVDLRYKQTVHGIDASTGDGQASLKLAVKVTTRMGMCGTYHNFLGLSQVDTQVPHSSPWQDR